MRKVILRMAILPEVQKQAQKNSFGSSKGPTFTIPVLESSER